MLMCYLAGGVNPFTPSQFQSMMTLKVNENKEIHTREQKTQRGGSDYSCFVWLLEE